MRSTITIAGAAALLALAGCSGNADDRAAENIEAAADARADNLEDQADLTGNETAEDALEDRADNVREVGEDAAEKADDSDDARVEGQVAPAINRM